MATFQDLANAIAQFEGWLVPGSLAQRNNNPGNLRASSLAVGTDANGFAIFPDAATGMQALVNQIQLDAGRGLDLSGFMTKYAPPSENDTSSYLSYVASKIGVMPDTPLTDLGPSPGPRPGPSLTS